MKSILSIVLGVLMIAVSIPQMINVLTRYIPPNNPQEFGAILGAFFIPAVGVVVLVEEFKKRRAK